MTDHRFIHVRDKAMQNFIVALDSIDLPEGCRTKLKHAVRGAVRYAYHEGAEGVKADFRELMGIAHPEDEL